MKLKQVFAAVLALSLLIGTNLFSGSAAVASTDCIDWTVDDNGEFQCTEWVNTDPTDDGSSQDAPTGLAIVSRTSTSVKLAWDDYQGATGWVLGISNDNAATWKELVVQNPAANAGLNLSDLKPASAMWVRVAALTPDRTPFSDSSFVTTKGAKSVTVRVVDAKGKPVSGGKITWKMVDNSARSSKLYGLTDLGVNVFPAAPAGLVDVTITNALTSSGALVSGSWRTTLGFDNTVLKLPAAEPNVHTVRVVLENGLPVVGAKVSIPKPTPLYGWDCIETKTVQVWVDDYYDENDELVPGHYENRDYCLKEGKTIVGYEGGIEIDAVSVVNGFKFVSPVGPYEGTTDLNGNFTISGFFAEDADATVVYDDGVITQEQIVPLDSELKRVELEYMPWVEVQNTAVTADPNQLVSVNVSIEDAQISTTSFHRMSANFTKAANKGVRVTLVPPKGVVSTKCKPKLTGTTDSKGKLTLKVCATKSAVFTVKSAGAAAVSAVRVQIKGTAPMAVRNASAKSPALGKATVSWTAPVFDGKSAIKYYKLVASAPGKKTVTKTVTSKFKTTTFSGLANATTYNIQIFAINAKGSSEAVTIKVPVA